MLIRTMVALCIMIICGTFSVVSNLPGLRNSINLYYAERMLDLIDEKIIEYYCHNSELPANLSGEFLRITGLSGADTENIVYVRNRNGSSFSLSFVKEDGTVLRTSTNSGRNLPGIPGYIDRTLTGGTGN